VIGQPRSTQRRQRHVPDDEPKLLKRIDDLATKYGRYGYRRATTLVHREGWNVNYKQVERLWRHFQALKAFLPAFAYLPPIPKGHCWTDVNH
jgi:transposase InsO family protein